MRISDVITRISAECPGFEYVDHILTSAADFARPAALVAPVRSIGARPSINIPGGYSQDVELILGVYIVLDRKQNGATGSGAADQFDDLVVDLRAAMINWAASGLIEPITYAGGEMAPYEPSVVTWREDFRALFEVRYP